MSNKMRWRYGDTNPVTMAVDAKTVIEHGDLLYLVIDDCRPASSQTDQGTLAGNQELFSDRFLGVAMTPSSKGRTAAIRIATTGVFEFDCAGDQFEVGDYIGAVESGVRDALLDQQVVKVSKSKYAIGRAFRREPASVTSILVDVRSTVMVGGVEGFIPAEQKVATHK